MTIDDVTEELHRLRKKEAELAALERAAKNAREDLVSDYRILLAQLAEALDRRANAG